MLLTSLSFASLLLLLIIIHELEHNYQIFRNEVLNPTVFNLLLTAGMFIIIIGGSTIRDISAIRMFRGYYGSSFLIDSNWVTSDSSNIFIGKTNKFLFFYKVDSQYSKIYPIDRIKEYKSLEFKH